MYDGEWQADNMHGRGKNTWAGGAVYDGEWQAGQMHGRGKNTYADDDARGPSFAGAVYDGEWQADKMHGRGKKTFADGRPAQDGRWEHKEFMG